MRILRCAILAMGIMGLALSVGACGSKDKGAENPANPCGNPCAEDDNPCGNPCDDVE